MASGLLAAELAATCSALGFYDGNKYHLEPHSKETIRDLIRYLRRDEDSHDIRRFLGNSKILQTDLIPILQCHTKEKELFDLILRLIVNLTTPALIVYNEVVPTEKSELNQYLQIVAHLQSYKEAFADHKSWTALTEQLSLLLNKDIDNRDDDDQRTIERILILIRNILHVASDALSEGRPDNDASVHDQVVWALHQSSMVDLLLYMASSSQESGFFMHLLEIICLLVREQPPSLLAKTAAQRSVEEKHRDEEELLKLRQKEQQFRQNKTRQYLGSRHSNFGGTFVIKNMKSTTDNDLIYHKPLHKVNHFSLDIEKKKVKIPKNRLPLKCGNVERRSALSVRLILKQFCVEILNAAYNPLMRHIKDCLSRGKTQDNDESYYFTAMKFFMEFNRMYKFQVKLVSETMSVETFHFVQKNLETWHEMMITDKKKIHLWSSRMHLALKAYKELLQNLAMMDANTDPAVRESSKVIKSNVFYVVEYREMMLTLINTYKKSKYSQQYLVDLVETTHIFMKLLSSFCQKKKLVVQKEMKIRKKSKGKKKNKPTQSETVIAWELWPQISEAIEKVLAAPITKEVIPFDATSEKTMEEQKIDAMKRIQLLLKSGDIEESVALLRAARDVWPENDSFGKSDLPLEEELNCLKEVFLADLDISGIPRNNKDMCEDEAENEDDSNEEDEDIYPTFSEQSVDFLDLVKRFASPKVMGVCITLLTTYETNSPFTNHCIAKMLHRIAWDCKLPSMLFQASLFRKFKTILESKDPAYKELAGLAVYIIRKFVEVATVNKKVFMELLFYKTAKDAYEIECGYGSFQKSTTSKQVWEEHEEDELRRLHKEYLETNPSEDMVTWITENLINEKNKRIIMKKMKDLGLHIVKTNKKGIVTTWTEEQEEELKNLYNEFKNIEGEDLIDVILRKLNQPRSRRIVASALVRLGCAESTKEFRKKTKSSGRSKKKTKGMDSDNGSEPSSSSSSESDEDSAVKESRDQIRAKEFIPDLYHTTDLIFSEKASHPYVADGLRWLSSSISDCMEDLDDEPAQVPLLPLSDEAMLSIENNAFKLFLSSIGVFKPLDQEIYWRFPAEWKENDFRTRKEFIDLIVKNEDMDTCLNNINILIKEISGKEPNMASTDDGSDTGSISPSRRTILNDITKAEFSSPDGNTKLKTLKMNLLADKKEDTKKNKNLPAKTKSIRKSNEKKKWTLENFNEVNTEDFNEIVAEECRELLHREGFNASDEREDRAQKSASKKILSSDSEEENAREVHRVSKKRSKLLADSDSDNDNEFMTEKIIPSQLPIASENEEKENSVNSVSIFKRSRIMNSDSEDELEKKTVKKKHIILSDDED